MARVVNGVVISADIEAVKEANRRSSGPFWFGKREMSFFNTRVHSTIYGGTYFVTSDRMDYSSPRRFTVRKLNDDGNISTEGEFQQYSSRYAAHAAAVQFAKNS